MIDARRIHALRANTHRGTLDNAGEAIELIVDAFNAEIERITREAFARFARDFTEQDIAAILGRPEAVREPRPGEISGR